CASGRHGSAPKGTETSQARRPFSCPWRRRAKARDRCRRRPNVHATSVRLRGDCTWTTYLLTPRSMERFKDCKRSLCLADVAKSQFAGALQDRVFDLNLGVRIDRRVGPLTIGIGLTEYRDVQRVGAQARVEDVDG